MYLSIYDTQKAIKQIKVDFEKRLSENLNLVRVSAPKFIRTNTGLQDDLANTCKSVKFTLPSCGFDVEIVHSLAKWKRQALQRYEVPIHSGLYTDMDAIRKDETLDFMHSAYVDQWDWEMCINKTDRNEAFLTQTVEKIYDAIKNTEDVIYTQYNIQKRLPEDITFIHTEEMEELYPNVSAKERENIVAKKYGAVFIIGIGYPLKNGKPHDIRAVDYDDWSTDNHYLGKSYNGLNGDIIVWNDITNCAFELSSMGIRVDATALKKQSEIMNVPIDMPYHINVLENKLPLTIGGGIGQSRLCMYLLQKQHIGEVQVSEWPDEMVVDTRRHGIHLL